MSTIKTANQHNLTALIIVTALLLVAAKLGYNKREEERAVKQEHMKKIEQNDAQIKHLFQTVDSLQKMAVKQTRDSLAKHPEFAYLEQNRAHIDSLRSANNKLFERAYNAAQKSSVFAVAQMNESLFSDFGNVPAVKRAKWPYYKNKKGR